MASVGPASTILLFENSPLDALAPVSGDDVAALAIVNAAAPDRADVNLPAYRSEVHNLMALLRGWVGARRERIQSAQLAVKAPGRLLFLVVQRERLLDESLSDELTELDLHVANSDEFRQIALDVLLIPFVSQASLSALIASDACVSYAK